MPAVVEKLQKITLVKSFLMLSQLKIVKRDVKTMLHALVTTCQWMDPIGVKHLRLSELQDLVKQNMNVGRKV